MILVTARLLLSCREIGRIRPKKPYFIGFFKIVYKNTIKIYLIILYEIWLVKGIFLFLYAYIERYIYSSISKTKKLC